MADNPITTPLPADLPTNWVYGQTIGPQGTDVGLTQQHGYNYLMQQVNAAQQAATQIGQAFSGLPSLGSDGKIPASQLPAMNYDPAGSAATVQTNLDAHVNNKSNPHGVTAVQVGARADTWVPSWGEVSGKPGTFPPSGHNHDASNIVSGILPVGRGGTGVTSLSALVDQIAANGGCRIEKVVRSGTGTNTEADAPSVTFSFPPKFVFLAEFFGRNGNSVSHAVAMDLIGTTATPDFGFCENTGNDYYAKKSSDGKTLYWWGEALWTIYNDIGKTYVLYGVG